MIAALVVAFQIAAASPSPAALVVKDASRKVSVPIVASPSGPLVRPDQLRPVVPITVSHLTGDRWMLIVGGSSIEVEEGLRFARVGESAFQLARAPEVRKHVLYVPLQLVVELMPRIAGNLAWDADKFELRAFSSTTRYEERTVSQSGRPVTAPRRDVSNDASPDEPASRGRIVGARVVRVVAARRGHGAPRL